MLRPGATRHAREEDHRFIPVGCYHVPKYPAIAVALLKQRRLRRSGAFDDGRFAKPLLGGEQEGNEQGAKHDRDLKWQLWPDRIEESGSHWAQGVTKSADDLARGERASAVKRIRCAADRRDEHDPGGKESAAEEEGKRQQGRLTELAKDEETHHGDAGANR